jgi:hypothetical protein
LDYEPNELTIALFSILNPLLNSLQKKGFEPSASTLARLHSKPLSYFCNKFKKTYCQSKACFTTSYKNPTIKIVKNKITIQKLSNEVTYKLTLQGNK